MITITRGKDKEFYINLISKETKRPADLTQLVTLKIKFLKDDGTLLTLAYPGSGIVVASVGGGRVKCSLEVAQTADLKKVSSNTLEVEYELGIAAADDPQNFKDTVYIPAAYQVVKSQYE